jgi:Uma2 family endonuclease
MIARIPPSERPARVEDISAANPGWKVEREADGSITMSPTGTRSGAHDIALVALLLRWQTSAGGQLFGSSTGFTMPDRSLLSPDAAWISGERWSAVPQDERDGYARIVPDVCIEVASKTDFIPSLVIKLRRYRAYGAAYALLIDPCGRTTWSEGDAPPGFPSDFTSVFDAGTH